MLEQMLELNQKIKGPKFLEPLILRHRGDVILTRDLYVPNVALYQTEPHPEANKILTDFDAKLILYYFNKKINKKFREKSLKTVIM